MATVYRANQTELDRVVALKVLKTSQFQTPEQQMRFRQEAQLINSLSHPNIADIYALGCSLFETLAGRPPFVADFYLQTLAQHRESAAKHPPELRPRN